MKEYVNKWPPFQVILTFFVNLTEVMNEKHTSLAELMSQGDEEQPDWVLDSSFPPPSMNTW